MKRGQFSYVNGHAQSHASLGRFKQQNHESRAESISRDIMYSKPNIKYYSNGSDQPNKITKKTNTNHNNNNNNINHNHHNNNNNNHKSNQELKQKNKQLQYELKKKITENCYLVKLFKTKNSSDVSHLDLYLEMRQMEELLNDREKQIEELKTKAVESDEKIEESAREVEQLLRIKDEQEIYHTNEIQTFSFQIDEYKKKCQKDLIQKQKALKEERKMREQKDLLLKQIKKQYEDMKMSKIQVERQLKETKDRNNCEKQEAYQQLQGQYEGKIEQLHDLVDKANLRDEEKDMIIEQLREKVSELVESQKKAQKVAEEKTFEIIEKNQQLKKRNQQLKKKSNIITQLQDQIEEIEKKFEEKNSTNDSSLIKIKKKISELQKNLAQREQKIRQQEKAKEKFESQLGRLQEELMQSVARVKILTFEREEKSNTIQKLQEKSQSKEKQSNNFIEQLETKLFTAQKRAHVAMERLKQLQKQLKMTKERKQTVSTKQIQNYKAMGRLTELTHNLKSLNSLQSHNHKTKKQKNRQIPSQQSDNIGECVDSLAQALQIFLKNSYSPLLQEEKNIKERMEETICDLKSILHAYNNFVQDQQLKGITRQYVEILEENISCNKKERNSYLQMIMQRLISMTAIQSYTSEKGIQRKIPEYSNNNNNNLYYKSCATDSLENTASRVQDHQQPEFDIKPYVTRERENSLKRLNKKYERQSQLSRSKLNKIKLQTEPDEGLHRKLEYDKQNILNRINRREIKNNYEGVKQYGSNHSMKIVEEEQNSIFKDRRDDILGKTGRTGSLGKFRREKGGVGEQPSTLVELQKKYYR